MPHTPYQSSRSEIILLKAGAPPPQVQCRDNAHWAAQMGAEQDRGTCATSHGCGRESDQFLSEPATVKDTYPHRLGVCLPPTLHAQDMAGSITHKLSTANTRQPASHGRHSVDRSQQVLFGSIYLVRNKRQS